jgi:hypothetical protein
MLVCVALHHFPLPPSVCAPTTTPSCVVLPSYPEEAQIETAECSLLKGRKRKSGHGEGHGCDSLDRTCKKLLMYLMGERHKCGVADGEAFDFKLSHVTAILGEPSHRRLYDILHVLHAVGIIKRHRHNKYAFLGVSCIPGCVRTVAERPTARDLNECSKDAKDNQAPKLFEVSQRLLQNLYKLGPNKIVTVADMLAFVSGGAHFTLPQTLNEKTLRERSRSCVSRRLYDAVSVLKGCGVVKLCRVVHPTGSKTRHPNTKSFMMSSSIFYMKASSISLDLEEDGVEIVHTDLNGHIREENRPDFHDLRRELERPPPAPMDPAPSCKKRSRLTTPELYMPYTFLSNNGYESPQSANVIMAFNIQRSPIMTKPNQDEFDVASFLTGLGSMPGPTRLQFDIDVKCETPQSDDESSATSPTSVVYHEEQPVCICATPTLQPRKISAQAPIHYIPSPVPALLGSTPCPSLPPAPCQSSNSSKKKCPSTSFFVDVSARI